MRKKPQPQKQIADPPQVLALSAIAESRALRKCAAAHYVVANCAGFVENNRAFVNDFVRFNFSSFAKRKEEQLQLTPWRIPENAYKQINELKNHRGLWNTLDFCRHVNLPQRKELLNDAWSVKYYHAYVKKYGDAIIDVHRFITDDELLSPLSDDESLKLIEECT